MDLTVDEIRDFQERGFAGPFRRFSPAEATERLQRCEREVFSREGPLPGHRTFMRHLDSRLVYDLCVHPSIIGRIAGLYGSNLMLWNTSVWDKPPGGPEIPWHQDLFYWPNEPPLNITAWIALTESTAANACLRVVPGSHKTIVPHVKAGEGMLFALGADPARVDKDIAIDVELQPGEFILFNDRLLHGSPPNTSQQRRLAFVARFTLPFVKLYRDRVPLFDEHRAIIVNGRDEFGFNKLADPPRDDES